MDRVAVDYEFKAICEDMQQVIEENSRNENCLEASLLESTPFNCVHDVLSSPSSNMFSSPPSAIRSPFENSIYKSFKDTPFSAPCTPIVFKSPPSTIASPSSPTIYQSFTGSLLQTPCDSTFYRTPMSSMCTTRKLKSPMLSTQIDCKTPVPLSPIKIKEEFCSISISEDMMTSPNAPLLAKLCYTPPSPAYDTLQLEDITVLEPSAPGDPAVERISTAADRISKQLRSKKGHILEIKQKVADFVRLLMVRVREWLENLTKKPSAPKCDCADRLTELESKLIALTEEMEMIRKERSQPQIQTIYVKMPPQEEVSNVPKPPAMPPFSCGPPCAPPPPPPPPPPLPPMGFMTEKKPIVRPPTSAKLIPAATPRPCITAQDLQSVRLKKVSERVANDANVGKSGGGPMVTLEQLRSVKLRSRRKTQTQSQLQSPTRTPLCRERVRKMKSPGFRRDRRSLVDRIPLSAILNMDEN